MTKTTERTRRFVLLDSDPKRYQRFLSNSVYLCRTAKEIVKVYDDVAHDLTWVAYTRRLTDELVKTVARQHARRSKLVVHRDQCVLTVAAPRPESVPALHGLFSRIIGDSPGYRWLPRDELTEVLLDSAGAPSELFITAAADPVTRTLSLVRGDCQQIVVPFALFPPSGDGTRPDFARVRVTDFGHTIALGHYEAAADAILYETDPDYRKQVNRQRQASEQSFGGSLLRLRKQRRLKRSDFAPLSAKTIARLERNEIAKPHGTTLQTIADRLQVAPDEIGDY